ncbi:adenosylcobinamide-phosphate synthase CbiB [Pseudomonas sp. HK3]
MPLLLESAIIILSALILDALCGEVKRFHPLVIFGHYVTRCEQFFYPKKEVKQAAILMRGMLSWCAAVCVPTSLLLSVYVISPDWLQTLLSVIVLYFAIGARSLSEHGNEVAKPLFANDMLKAREQLSMIVSRDTQDLNETQISSATVETITENTHDAVIAPIFWFLALGVAGVIVFRLANTLDAMWGYRNARYEYFGKFSARVDDVLGWPSARLTVGLFIIISVLKGRIKGVLRINTWARSWYSPNAGPVMAAGAFALNVRLGGPAPYHGVLKSRPWLGDGEQPKAAHIKQSILLMYQSSYVLVCILFAVGAIQWLY